MKPTALQVIGGALVMLLCAALVDLWFCWPAGADIDAYEFLVYLVVLGTFAFLLLRPRLHGPRLAHA